MVLLCQCVLVFQSAKNVQCSSQLSFRKNPRLKSMLLLLLGGWSALLSAFALLLALAGLFLASRPG